MWTAIESISELEQAIDKTEEKPGLFFKHSTRCGISSMALSRFEREWEETEDCNLYFIDLLAHRDVSNKLAELTNVGHQSPQAILVKDKKEVYNASHNGISATAIKNSL